jgi:hypothetical protein
MRSNYLKGGFEEAVWPLELIFDEMFENLSDED